MRRIPVFLITLFLVGCVMGTPTPAGEETTPTTPVPLTPAASTPTETPIPHTTVDASTMEHKLLMGYQGWFSCPGDGSRVGRYFHWFRGESPTAGGLRVDMWPDTSELTPDERCETDMHYPDGQPAYLYSAYNPLTVMRHFEWMSQYGVDGVFLQRFGTELLDPVFFDQRNKVTKNVKAGAEAYGRVFAIMYDTSGMDGDTMIHDLEKDWKYLVDILNVTESPAYLRHAGKPVVALWGLGFIEHPGTPDQALELLDFFQNNPEPRYQATVMGGVPTSWRILQNDALTDPGWADYYCALDVLSPWTVGRYADNIGADLYKLTMEQDMAAASACGVEYMPVVYPGTAFHNDSGTPFNLIPRQGGDFYWRQVYNAVSIGVPMIYNAMFDEVDEATAMFKMAATTADQPVGVDLISMDADGYQLPNDWYLQLAGAASEMLRGDIPLTSQIPISSGAEAPPTPSGMYRIRIQFTTSSDWATLTLLSGGTLSDQMLVSASPEVSGVWVTGDRISIGQPIARAGSGASVELVIDAALTDLQAGIPLQFLIESGAIGYTTVTLFNLLEEPALELNSTTLYDMSLTYEVGTEAFIVP